MSRTRRILHLAASTAGAAALFACGSDDPMVPELEEVDSSTVVFLSEFDDENGGNGALNWTEFEEWDVMDGCVDLHGNDFIDVWPNNGVYVDLDGTCEAGGTLQSKEAVTLRPGEYMLEFWLAGNNRIEAPDTVNVALGSLHTEQIVLEPEDEFRLFSRPISVSEETSALLSFQNLGGDDQGALLDLVRVRERGEEDL